MEIIIITITTVVISRHYSSESLPCFSFAMMSIEGSGAHKMSLARR
jgi:hypothetical protein